jgi:polar amino acid transport system substrate-binding protein
MSSASHKAAVHRFFEEVVDKGNLGVVDELYTADCMVHRLEYPRPIAGPQAWKQALSCGILQVYGKFKTTIHELIAEDDRVACRLSHKALHREDWTSRIGRHAVAGKAVGWQSMVVFHFRDGKIAEQWVIRDELGMLIELGILPRHPMVNGVEDLVRTGKVRVALFPPTYSKDPVTGELRGWAVDLASALGTRLGVEVQPIEYPTPREVLEDLKAGGCDVAFLTIDPSRTAQVDFSRPLIQFDYTCLVPAGSSIRSVADADRPGVRIAVVSNHASTLALSRIVKHAELVGTEIPDAAFNLLRTGDADAFASIRPNLLDYSTRLPGSRVLEDRYGASFLGLVVPKGHTGWLAHIDEFIEEAKASGLVQRAIERMGWRGVQVAPPGSHN